jgi:hypothetical protein
MKTMPCAEKKIKLEVGQDHFDMLAYGLICARKTVNKELAEEYSRLIRVMFQLEEDAE